VGTYRGAYAYGYWPVSDLDGYHWYYGGRDGSRLSAGVIPTNDGLACVFVGASPDVLAAAVRARGPATGLHHLAARLDGELGELVATPSVGSVRSFRGIPGLLRRARGPGWALVGDAGWWKDPLSTHGITDALRDAEALAGAVVAGGASHLAAGDVPSGYSTQRDRWALAMHPIVDRLASHEWDLAEARRLLRALSSVMADEVEAIQGVDPVFARTG
jgi:flavin-dependent dehydrogenase